MTQPKLKVALVGTGNVATHIARALGANGTLCAVFSRDIEKARALAGPFGAVAADSYAVLRQLRPDVVLISIADHAVASLVADIGPLDFAPLVLHTSGTLGKETLLPLSPRTGVLYPLQTFSADAAVNLRAVPFFTEAERDGDLPLVDALAESLSDVVRHADAAHRRVLHIAGVFTSNFTNVLLECVERVLAPAGYDLDVVRPLLGQTCDKAFAMGPHDAQTGPARRGDFAVIKRQENALPPEMKPAYRALTDLIFNFHAIKNEQN